MYGTNTTNFGVASQQPVANSNEEVTNPFDELVDLINSLARKIKEVQIAQKQKERDFQREQGKTVDVSLFAPLDGAKVLTGELKAYDGQAVTVGEQTIPMEKIAKVNLHIDF